jgi:hypothetical protein
MKELEEVKRIIEKYKPTLKEKFKVKSVGLFGSYVKGDQSEQSDLDVLVEFYETIDLFEFIRLENLLSEIIGVKVDLVMKDALKPQIRDRILEEVIYI